MIHNQAIKVLSLNTYILGLITYQTILENILPCHFPGIEFHSLHLTDHNQHDLLTRLIYWLLSRRLIPGTGKRDYEFHRFRCELGISLGARYYLEKTLRHYHPQVLHLHTQGQALLSAGLMKRFPTALSISYTAALLMKEHPTPAYITYQPIAALEKRCFEAATHIVTCSQRARQSVIADYGISPEKVTHIDYSVLLNHLIDIPRLQPEPARKTRLLFVGNDFPRKGGLDLLSVFLEEFSETCELVLVTNANVDAPNLPNLRICKGVRHLSPEFLQHFQEADIFVMPTHEDVYGIVFQEAMAAGLPCIGTTVMAVPELVQHGQTGLTVPPGDRPALAQAIQTLVQNPGLRYSMGLTGRAMAKQRFDPIVNCGRLTEIFSRCAQMSRA